MRMTLNPEHVTGHNFTDFHCLAIVYKFCFIKAYVNFFLKMMSALVFKSIYRTDAISHFYNQYFYTNFFKMVS